jgi:hypothetical protein
LGQLGEQRLLPAIEVDVAGVHSHAKALDADTTGPLAEIHRRVGAAILFESTGVASDKAAHLPELRFALGEPELDITSIDNAASALEKRSYYIKKFGTDGLRIGYKPTLKKIVGDRKAGLDDSEVIKAIRTAVKQEFDKGRVVDVEPLTTDGNEVPDSPKLKIVVVDPQIEWNANGEIRTKLNEWTRFRNTSPRFYPAALVWLVRRPGRQLRERAEMQLSWQRVSADIASGVLGSDFDASDKAEVAGQIKDSADALRDEVWSSYRYAVIADPQGAEGLREIDLGAGHSSGGGSLTARVVAALKSEGLLNDSVGAGYLDRNWPPALKESGIWPLKGLRQAFLDGTLTRLIDPEDVLRRQVVKFVHEAEFGLASGPEPNGGYEHVWFKQTIGPEEVVFDDKTFLLTRTRAASLTESPKEASPTPVPQPTTGDLVLQPPSPGSEAASPDQFISLSLRGSIPPEQWNKLGTRLLPKLRAAGHDIALGFNASLNVRTEDVRHVEADLRQALRDLGLEGLIQVIRE